MSPLRKTLCIVAVLSVAGLGGCQWLILSGVLGGGYVAGGEQMTKDLTVQSHAAGAAHVGDAMQTWLNRGQLPLPVPGEGAHNYSMSVGSKPVAVKGSLGARKVELFDNGNLVADYVVAWDKQPYEYRVASATNRLYDAPLDVTAVPVIPTYW